MYLCHPSLNLSWIFYMTTMSVVQGYLDLLFGLVRDQSRQYLHGHFCSCFPFLYLFISFATKPLANFLSVWYIIVAPTFISSFSIYVPVSVIWWCFWCVTCWSYILCRHSLWYNRYYSCSIVWIYNWFLLLIMLLFLLVICSYYWMFFSCL